jgi:hypothetical protein
LLGRGAGEEEVPMAWQGGRVGRVVVAVIVIGLLGAVPTVFGGMAELGRQRTVFLEAVSSPGAGDGAVAIFLGPNPTFAHSRRTGGCMSSPETDCNLATQAEDCDGGTCVPRTESQILDLLADDIGPAASHVPGTRVITIGQDDIGIRSTDSQLQYVKASRGNPGQVSLLEATEPPVGGIVSIIVTNEDGVSRRVDVNTVPGSVSETNEAIRAALVAAEYELGTGPQGRIVIRRDDAPGMGPNKKLQAVDWDDTDLGSGIQTIGAFASPSQGVASPRIPTLSGRGILLMMAVLGALALILLRRQQRLGGT